MQDLAAELGLGATLVGRLVPAQPTSPEARPTPFPRPGPRLLRAPPLAHSGPAVAVSASVGAELGRGGERVWGQLTGSWRRLSEARARSRPRGLASLKALGVPCLLGARLCPSPGLLCTVLGDSEGGTFCWEAPPQVCESGGAWAGGEKEGEERGPQNKQVDEHRPLAPSLSPTLLSPPSLSVSLCSPSPSSFPPSLESGQGALQLLE